MTEWKQGKPPSLKTLVLIAALGNTSLDWLLKDDGLPPAMTKLTTEELVEYVMRQVGTHPLDIARFVHQLAERHPEFRSLLSPRAIKKVKLVDEALERAVDAWQDDDEADLRASRGEPIIRTSTPEDLVLTPTTPEDAVKWERALDRTTKKKKAS